MFHGLVKQALPEGHRVRTIVNVSTRSDSSQYNLLLEAT